MNKNVTTLDNTDLQDHFLTHFATHYLMIDDGKSVVLNDEGEFFDFSSDFKQPVFCINTPLVIRNAGYSLTQRYDFLYDIAELAIFLHPTSGIMPTLKDLLSYFKINQADYAITDLYKVLITTILQSYHGLTVKQQKSIVQKIYCTYHYDWCWAGVFLQFLNLTIPDDTSDNAMRLSPQTALANWDSLSNNEQKKNLTYDSNQPINYDDAMGVLSVALHKNAEDRPQQNRYVQEITKVFEGDLTDPEIPQKAILCEAGTGTGKTLGYLAPAIAWATKNQRPAIISTYSKALQNQVASELTKFFPNPQDYDNAIVMRKGRENYICLKQYQAALLEPYLKRPTILYLTFIASWIESTQNGDLSDIYFPLWLTDFFPNTPMPKLTVSANECTYQKCTFYQKCFAEKNNIKSDKTKIIITNHAFLMSKFQNNPVSDEFSGALIIDEAHHVFSAADNIYNVEFNLKTLGDFRAYLLGHKDQAGQLLAKYDETINTLLHPDFKVELYKDVLDLLHIFEGLPNKSNNHAQSPDLFVETQTVYHQLMTSLQEQLWAYFSDNQEISLEDYSLMQLENSLTSDQDYSEIFADVYNHLEEMRLAIHGIFEKCRHFITPSLDADSTKKIHYFRDFLTQKVLTTLNNYHHIISEFHHGSNNDPKDHILYCYKNAYDHNLAHLSLVKRYLNPTEFFGHHILSHIRRLVLTSAGLRANTDNNNAGWDFAQQLTGMHYRTQPPLVAHIPSDFDYAKQAKILVINDILNTDPEGYVQAFIKMAKASGGGVLGLFTAITRLKNCYKKVVAELRHNKILTLAMHQAIANNQTLIQLFKQDGNAVLLGTDLMRDGIDIPGDALRLVVFERVPWQRSDLIYKKRCALFKEHGYDKFLVKQKIKQAFGRLIRTKNDKGCFVLIASRCPSDILTALPPECEIKKLSTNEAVKEILLFQS
ncbi:MAG: ATP-dependent DNA helicase DinG [Dasania sp.]|jgi:ATP-dependent DNA helicase DinG